MKVYLKNKIGPLYSVFKYPMLVNSYGRSGSTVLTKSIIKSAINADNKIVRSIAYRSIFQTAWNLQNTDIQNGILYKTHDYPPENDFKNGVRMLYTFSDPVDVVLSLLRLYDQRGEEWLNEHYDHLKLNYTNFKGIIEQDQLRMGSHLESWLEEKRFPIAFIRYETMWDHQNEISEFLGFPITLPPFKKRKAKSKKEDELRLKLETTYRSLRKKIEIKNDFFTHNT